MSNTEFKFIRLGLQKEITLYEYERGLLYENGRFTRLLEAGRYRYPRWKNVTITPVSTRLISEVITGQEILSADKIEVRVSLIAVYRIADPVLAINSVADYSEQLYHDLQLVLRESVANREMAALLEARGELSQELLDGVQPQAAEYGIDLRRVGIRDLMLPRQVRDVFLREVEADLQGRAELVKARHEVAAARARANTAKILTENPAILRLQEIDALVQLAGRHGNVVLLPNLADLLTGRDAAPTVAANGKGQDAES